MECHAGRGIENKYRVLLEEASEREDDAGVAFNEAAIEVGEAEEGLEVSDRLRLRPGEDGIDLGGCHGYAVVGDDESEELGRGFGELALLCLGIESIGDDAARTSRTFSVCWVGSWEKMRMSSR